MKRSEFNQLKKDFAAGLITHEQVIVKLNQHYTGREIGDKLQEVHQYRINKIAHKAQPKAGKVRKGKLQADGSVVWS